MNTIKKNLGQFIFLTVLTMITIKIVIDNTIL